MLLSPDKAEKIYMIQTVIEKTPGWDKQDKCDIKLKTLNGLSNKVVLASVDESIVEKPELSKVVIKQKNPLAKNHPMKCFHDEAEETILSNSYGPQVLYNDSNFQITEYIESRELNVEDFKNQFYRMQVASAVGKFTKMSFEKEKFNKEPLQLYLLKDYNNYQKGLHEKLERDAFSDKEKELLSQALSLISQTEFDYLQKLFDSEDDWDLRFSHNDLFYANVLQDFKKNEILQIDYDYSSVNPFGWDLGHMCNEATQEYSRYKFDWPYYKYTSGLFPNDQELKDILKVYMIYDENDDSAQNIRGCEVGEEWVGLLKKSSQWANFDDSRLEVMLRKFKKIMVMTQYFWMIWVMLDLRNPMFPQDTIHFINQRCELYLSWKDIVKLDS